MNPNNGSSIPGYAQRTRPAWLLLAGVAAVNLAVWAAAATAFLDYPLLLGTALIAYSFGLRHGFDADHIAAIDNVIRKLMQTGARPLATGLWFSLGHATVVVLLSIAIVFATATIRTRFSALSEFGEVAGTVFSAGLLIAIGIANTAILVSLVRAYKKNTSGEALDALLSARGFLARWFRRLFTLVTRSWQIYFIGLLFGLGFDTATEIGLLGISAAEASRGLPLIAIMLFPALFTAGMALVDTIDSVLMVDTYSRSFCAPAHKLLYNAVVTGLSVVTAFAVGSVELLRLLKERFELTGGRWQWIELLDSGLAWGGFLIVAVFIAVWTMLRLKTVTHRTDIAR